MQELVEIFSQKDRKTEEFSFSSPYARGRRLKQVLSICLSVFFEHACRWIPYTGKRVVFFLQKSPLKIWKFENFVVSLYSYLAAVSYEEIC